MIRNIPAIPSFPNSLFLSVLGIFCFFLSPSGVKAADSSGSVFAVFDTIGSDISDVWSDLGPYVTRPLSFDGKDWRNTSFILGGTALGTTIDNSGRNFALKSPHDVSFEKAMTFSKNLGENYMISGAALTYLVGLGTRQNQIRIVGRELIESLLLSAATTTTLKYIMGRSRPYTGSGPYTFHPLSFSFDKNSMPSGHTTVAFAITSVLAARIDHPLASILLYGAATCTAFSRMYHDQHWFSDTFFGAAIAMTTGLWVVNRDREREGNRSRSESNLLITPSIGGLSLTYKF